MAIEKAAAKAFQMTDAVWERHANPWSVWTRYPCLPLLALAIWSRSWIGWISLVPILLSLLWIWLNPRVFRKPGNTNHWASRAVMGERILLANEKADMPAHHLNAIRAINLVTFTGFVAAAYGLIVFNPWCVAVGTLIMLLGKTWFLDRMVWLYQDLSASNEVYSSWLY